LGNATIYNNSKLKILLFILFILTVFVIDSKGVDPIVIKLNNPAPVQFCSGQVLVAESLTIGGTPNIQGMKISISEGFIAGEDELVYSGKLFSSVPFPGTLVLTGSNIAQDYVDAIRTISYKNNKTNPSLGVRKITISLNDVDYLPETGHFYRFIQNTRIRWTDAELEAKSDRMMYYVILLQ
jgi:hypothetical protein